MVAAQSRDSVRGLLALALLAAACSDRPASVGAEPENSVDAGVEEWFTDRAHESGLDFVHFNGMTGRFHFPEVIPPGVALLDYDGDSDLDVFVAQGEMLGKQSPSEALQPPQGPLKSRLYRNDLAIHVDGTRTLRFVDVTGASGIAVLGYAIGAATGDFNNDGCVDLYVTNLERSQLFRNDCDGSFTDVSTESGAGNRGWSVSAAFVDYDRDGWLGLVVGSFVRYRVEGVGRGRRAGGGRVGCWGAGGGARGVAVGAAVGVEVVAGAVVGAAVAAALAEEARPAHGDV